jgi:hypothetical protein
VTLDYRGSGSTYSVTYTHGNLVTGVAANVTRAPLDMGIWPLALGGSWTFTDPRGSPEQCTATLLPSSMTARCSNVTGWESPLLGLVPRPEQGNTYTATRSSSLASDFADIGGVWTTSDSVAGPGACTVTIQSNQFSASCSGIFQWGTVQANFVGGTMVSGTTGSGVEFTAQKR